MQQQNLVPVCFALYQGDTGFGEFPFFGQQGDQGLIGLAFFRRGCDADFKIGLPVRILRPVANGVARGLGTQADVKAIGHLLHCGHEFCSSALREKKSMAQKDSAGKKAIIGWCLYDAGNSAFSTVIVTFLFSVYFARGVVGDETAGSALWGYAVAASGVIVALMAPLLGALADHYGARKSALTLFSLLCILATSALYGAAPAASPVQITIILAIFVIANTGFEMALVYANAMLPHIAPVKMIGRISGWSWAAGYAGGLVCLVLALILFVGIDGFSPLLALPQDQSQHIRATAPMTALWFAVMSVPLLLWTGDAGRTGLALRAAAARGWAQLVGSIRNVKSQRDMMLFLLSSALYRDGLNTLFAVGGLYATGTFGMSFSEILVFAIGLNVAAGLGAVLFSFADDFIGSKKTIILSLLGLVVTGAGIFITADKDVFILLAMALGIFIGPAQAASRTMVARLSPVGAMTQNYGLYALTGKTVSFLGPLCFALATSAFDSQRAGMATIIVFWLAGLAVLMLVKERRA